MHTVLGYEEIKQIPLRPTIKTTYFIQKHFRFLSLLLLCKVKAIIL